MSRAPHKKSSTAQKKHKDIKQTTSSSSSTSTSSASRHASALASFHTHYRSQYTDWSILYPALLQPTRHCALINQHVQSRWIQHVINGISDVTKESMFSIPVYILPRDTTSTFPSPSSQRDLSDQLLPYYLLDAASLFPVIALDVHPGLHILDMCAAPGGKSVAIMQYMKATVDNGTLTCNEHSISRRQRLQHVINDYAPFALKKRITVMGQDATEKRFGNARFDRILVDAPCSSDRHVLSDPSEMLLWTPARTRTIAQRQLLILLSALTALKPGGRCVYATCSLSRIENDDIIERVMKKSKIGFEVIHQTFPIGVATKYGWIVLPHHAKNTATTSASTSTPESKYTDTSTQDSTSSTPAPSASTSTSASTSDSTSASTSPSEGWGPLYFSILRRYTPQEQQQHVHEDSDDDDGNEDDEDEDDDDDDDEDDTIRKSGRINQQEEVMKLIRESHEKSNVGFREDHDNDNDTKHDMSSSPVITSTPTSTATSSSSSTVTETPESQVSYSVPTTTPSTSASTSASTSTSTSSINDVDRCIGSLLWSMCGDVLGAAVEGFPAEMIQKQYGVVRNFMKCKHMGLRHLDEQRYGMYTDDTCATFALAESIVKNNGLCAYHAARSYATWFLVHKPQRGCPYSAQAVMEAILAGVDHTKTGTMCFPDGSFANGGAMRIAPVGLAFSRASDSQLRHAVAQAIISSHVHPEAIEGAFLIAKAIAILRHLPSPSHMTPDTFLSQLISVTRNERMLQHMRIIESCRQQQTRTHGMYVLDSAVIKQLGDTFQLKAVEAVPFAIWIMMECWNRPEDAIIRAVNAGGDTDTIAAIVGAMAGALHGMSSLPSRWYDDLENGERGRDYAIELAKQLAMMDLHDVIPDPVVTLITPQEYQQQLAQAKAKKAEDQK